MRPNYRVLFIETYPTGSHRRMLDLITKHSRHEYLVALAPRDEWRWVTGAAHHHIIRSLDERFSSAMAAPDLIVFSGPLNTAGIVAGLPAKLRDVPRVTFFHESQWTYPNPPTEILPYLLGHIDSVALSDASWFNSEYHRRTFKQHTLNASMRRMRRLARDVIHDFDARSRVLYPPVELEACPTRKRSGTGPTIAWAARWEQEKRPDLFVRAMARVREAGLERDGCACVLCGT
ncbi:MAG: tRNA-queuosine alpha-mannosyltransferase domain-containing protein, partial [Chloroflexota bacterium]